MKFIFPILVFITININAQIVSPDSARFHEGFLTTVCGKVIDTYQSKSKTIFLNFGNSYPNHTFTGVIMAKDTVNFKYKPADYLKGKEICVMGMIKMYNNKPEVIIKSSNQIREQ